VPSPTPLVVEKRFEMCGWTSLWNSGAVVDEFDLDVVTFVRDADRSLPLSFMASARLSISVCPDLIHVPPPLAVTLGTWGANSRLDLDAFFQLVLHDRQSGFNAAHDVLLHWRLVHVGIFPLMAFTEGGDGRVLCETWPTMRSHLEKCGETHEAVGMVAPAAARYRSS